MMESKGQLRRQLRSEALLHGMEQRKEESRRLVSLLETDEHFLQAENILLYHALSDEISLSGILSRWSSSKRLYLPRVIKDDLQVVPVGSETDLQSGAFGILEPQGDAINDLIVIDLVIVPGMAFDVSGRRLGRGKGYYDRLLANMPTAFRIGVCHSWQIVPEVPHEPHDILMDKVLFPA